jgi:hypothetical protein
LASLPNAFLSEGAIVVKVSSVSIQLADQVPFLGDEFAGFVPFSALSVEFAGKVVLVESLLAVGEPDEGRSMKLPSLEMDFLFPRSVLEVVSPFVDGLAGRESAFVVFGAVGVEMNVIPLGDSITERGLGALGAVAVILVDRAVGVAVAARD